MFVLKIMFVTPVTAESQVVCRIVNYSDELRQISRLLGPNVEKYYTWKFWCRMSEI